MNPQCIICEIYFLSTDNLYSTDCGHVFHNQCLTKWLKRSKTCPQCRQETDNEKTLRIWLNDGGLNTSFLEDVGEIKKELEAKLSEIAKNEKDIKYLKDVVKSRENKIQSLEENLKSQQKRHENRYKKLQSKFNRCQNEKEAALRDLEDQKNRSYELTTPVSSTQPTFPRFPTYWEWKYQSQYNSVYNYYYQQ